MHSPQMRISKKVQASMRASAEPFWQLSRRQGRAAAIENPPFAGAGEGFVKKKAGLVELSRQFLRRALEIVSPRARGARISRVGKMGYVGYAGPLLLHCDFTLE